MIRVRAWAAAVALLAALVPACGGGRQTVRGVVIDVQGSITAVDEFVLRLPDGTDLRLVPVSGISFHDSAPIGHLRDHLRSGETVTVEFEVLDDGTAAAYSVGD